METTIFLAKIYGPIIFAVGLGIFLSRSYYIKIYRELEKDALAGLLFGMVAMASGIVQLQFHNVWDTFPQVLISLIGWGLIIKGVLFVVSPKTIDKAGDFWVHKNLIPVAGLLTLIAGAYLSWVGYFA